MLRCLAGPSIIALLWFLSRRTIQERTQAEHHTVKRNLWLPHLAQTALREEADPKHLTYMPQTSKDKGTPALPGATWARKGRRAPLRAHNIVRTHQNHCELNMYLYRKSHPLFGEATNPQPGGFHHSERQRSQFWTPIWGPQSFNQQEHHLPAALSTPQQPVLYPPRNNLRTVKDRFPRSTSDVISCDGKTERRWPASTHSLPPLCIKKKHLPEHTD